MRRIKTAGNRNVSLFADVPAVLCFYFESRTSGLTHTDSGFVFFSLWKHENIILNLPLSWVLLIVLITVLICWLNESCFIFLTRRVTEHINNNRIKRIYRWDLDVSESSDSSQLTAEKVFPAACSHHVWNGKPPSPPAPRCPPPRLSLSLVPCYMEATTPIHLRALSLPAPFPSA